MRVNMKSRFHAGAICLALGMVPASAALAISPASLPATSRADVATQVVAQIRQELQAVQGRLAVPPAKAVAMLDRMLVQQYGATGHLAAEPDITLKPDYYAAATLLLNGYPIAGGTVVSSLRQEPAWRTSPSAPALGAFVNAMLTPTGEDDLDLLAFQRKAAAVKQGLRSLPFEIRFPAEVMLVGEIYGDAIATKAGSRVLESQTPSAAVRSQVESARRAAAAIPVPTMPPEQP